MGQPVHRVRLHGVHAKLAIRRGGKRQNQISVVIHQEEVVIHYQSRVQQVRWDGFSSFHPRDSIKESMKK